MKILLFIFLPILALLTGCNQQDNNYRVKPISLKKLSSEVYYNINYKEVCIDGVIYIWVAERMSVKFKKDSTVQTCEEE